jgi:hypothetical protein
LREELAAARSDGGFKSKVEEKVDPLPFVNLAIFKHQDVLDELEMEAKCAV